MLVVTPWSPFWDRNFFVARLPALAAFFDSPFVRGGVSGIGAVTALAGLAEIAAAIASRRPQPTRPERNAET